MRKSAYALAIIMLALSVPGTHAQINDPCRAWTCVYEYPAVEQPPNAACYEIGSNKGQWVACNERQECWWVVTENGRQKQCTLPECEGELCMWL